MTTLKTLLLMCAALIAASQSAFAQVGGAVETGHARTRLVSAQMAAAPGETITLAIVQQLEDGWHVYWRNPGDSGLPLNLNWTLPDGYVAGEILYPLPHRLPLGPLINYGHEGEPVFLVDVDVPEAATPGTTVPISVDAEWLICDDICVPESATLKLLLPIAETPGAPTLGYADRIEAARAEQPIPAPFSAAYHDDDNGPVLRISSNFEVAPEFYPFAPSLIEPSAPVVPRQLEGELWLGFTKGFAYGATPPNHLSGVLVVRESGELVGYSIHAPLTDRPVEPVATSSSSDNQSNPITTPNDSVVIALLLALLGGVVLNLMPCVFPIVFLKAAGFAAIPREDRGRIRSHGLLYTAGVLSAFAALGVLLFVLRAGGEQLGWGFHLQSPVAVGIFAIIIFAIGLNLAGVFEWGTSVQGVGSGLAERSGHAGAFFTGLLAVAVAAPCIGPFLGGAIGLALSRGDAFGILIFLAIGAGLALPYLLISVFPVLSRLLPKPGAWMSILKQLFSFAMFGTVVWLAWVLSMQASSEGVLALGISLLAVGLSAWLFGLTQKGSGRSILRVLAVILLVAAIVPIWGLKAAEGDIQSDSQEKLSSVDYSASALEELRAANTPVFVDFTAAWCVTCQFNKKTVLDTQQVIEAFKTNQVTYMVADWTVRDPEITAALEAQGRAGVPLYLYYAPGADAPEVLPALLSKGIMLSLFEGRS